MTDDVRDNLTAYLDGELSGPEAQQVEERLRRDPALRAEADALKRAWELLDVLPPAEPSPSFTNRTLDRVTARRHAAVTSLQRRRRWLGVAGWVGGAVAAAALGFFAVSLRPPPEPTDDDLARDLRLLENKRLYEQVDSLDFLKALDHPDLFGDDSPEAGG